MGRDKRRSNQIGTKFVAVPNHVIESPGFSRLEHASVRILLLIATQYTGRNNGKLVACRKFTEKYGIKSNNTLSRAVADLQINGLIFCTRKGARPNKASWYMLTWRPLDLTNDMDVKQSDVPHSPYLNPGNIATLTPVVGIGKGKIVPIAGVRESITRPIAGAM